MIKGDLAHPQIVFGGYLLGGDQVKPGLGFAGVGDGRGADFKIAFGKGQLLVDRFLLRPHKCQRVLRGQHVEVRLAGANDQVLRRRFELCPGQINLLESLFITGPVAGPVQRLAGAQRSVLSIEAGGAAGRGGGAFNADP